MAIDLKYGQVTTERGSIGEDEPVVVFRAQDILLPKLLTMYYSLCKEAGSPEKHLELIEESQYRVVVWQGDTDFHQTKVPESASYQPPGEPE